MQARSWHGVKRTREYLMPCALRGTLTLALLAGADGGRAAAQEAPLPATELKRLSLEELMGIEVSTVSKRIERLSGAASAIQVITAEDIRRSGAASLPEALRLASNLQVAQLNSHDWAISARGFNGAPLSNSSLANKLLVLVDGRAVYTPLFGGVFWDVQSVPLEDVDRIEVISGPGGTLWGANAVNGVVNVITKPAAETPGVLATAGGGSFLRGFGTFRYGASLAPRARFRAYGRHSDREATELRSGATAGDAWRHTQSGFRVEYDRSQRESLTVQGDAYDGVEGSPTTATVNGQNILGRYTRAFSSESEVTVQAYVDRTSRHLPAASFGDQLTTYDVDLQHRLSIGRRHSVLWGAGYRLARDDVDNSPFLAFTPADRDLELFSAFVQDEIAVVPDRLRLTLGTKVEHHEFSGFGLQPSARLAWTVNDRYMVWAAGSRALHPPSRFEGDLSFPVGGDTSFDPEVVISYELGFRARPAGLATVSVAAFYNDYSDLRALAVVAPPPRVVFANGQEASTYGVEVSGALQVSGGWRLKGGFTYLHKSVRATIAGVVPTADAIEGMDPRKQAVLQSVMDLPGRLQLDVVARYVDELPATALPTAPVPAYSTFDVRLAREFGDWEVAIVGTNLAAPRHAEFATQIPRSAFGRLTWRP